MSEQVPLFVTLLPPKEIHTPLKLTSGHYKYDEPTNSGAVKTSSGRVEMTLGQGGWQAKLPQVVLDKPIELLFEDSDGNWWGVPPFYPNHNTQAIDKTSHRVDGPHTQLFPEPAVGQALAAVPSPDFREPPSPLASRTAQALKFTNYARPLREFQGRTYYQWRVFMDEPPEVLDRIAEVQYVLHPTFPEPFQVRSDPRTKFALETNGWGEFRIIITIRYKDGKVEKTSYYLDLDKEWPSTNPH